VKIDIPIICIYNIYKFVIITICITGIRHFDILFVIIASFKFIAITYIPHFVICCNNWSKRMDFLFVRHFTLGDSVGQNIDSSSLTKYCYIPFSFMIKLKECSDSTVLQCWPVTQMTSNDSNDWSRVIWVILVSNDK
jgi:hypothetical protein